MSRFSLSAVGLATLLCAGCNRPPADHPVDAYLHFTRVAERDPAAGYEALSKRTREVLAEKAKALSDKSGGAINNSPAQIFFSRPGRATPVGEVKVIEQSGDVARLQVTSGAEATEIRMVREDARWRVDLAELVGASAGGAGQ